MWELTNGAEGRALVGATFAFAAWMLMLTVALVSSRGVAMAGGSKITEFPAGIPHGGDRYWRLNRAHANTAENVGLVAAVLLGTLATGIRGADVQVWPWVIVAARVAQSAIHVTSASAVAVRLRFAVFAVQLVSLGWLTARCLVVLVG